jgi:MFS family permease
LGFGYFSDVWGRKLAFNITLLIMSVFGIIAAFAPSYNVLCIISGMIGVGIGGNLPIAGNLFLESTNKENLLTLLSVFWSLGNILSASLGWSLLPPFSCLNEDLGDHVNCEDNRGWRYLLFTQGSINIIFWVGTCFFRYHDSVKYLLARGRTCEVVDILAQLKKDNKVHNLDIKVADLVVIPASLDNDQKQSLSGLFSRRNARVTIVRYFKQSKSNELNIC